MDEQIIYNAIRSPDGTVLVSRHRHDYVTHTDANGKDYMVDGGLVYLRRILTTDAIELSQYDDGTVEHARQYLEWGTRGKDGDQPLTYKKLKDLDTDHIKAILDDNDMGKCHLSPLYLEYFTEELIYREENESDD